MRINKDQIKLSRWHDLLFSYRRGKGHMVPYLANRFAWYYYPRFHHVSKFPGHLDIETSAVCNMQCPMCFTTAEAFRHNVDKGLMAFEVFKKVIDEAVQCGAYSIRISHRGEPFVHPEIIDFIEYAKQSGIREVSSLSNILALTPELFEEAMKKGLDWLTISFDGLSDTYEWIRKPAKFEESYERIREYKKIKAKSRSIKPVIKVQSIWSAIKDCADEWVRLLGPYVDNLASNPLIDYLHKDDVDKIEYWENFDCPTPYQRMTVLFDGKVPYCHNDEFNSWIIGDANKQSICDIWNGAEMNSVRKAHSRHEGVNHLPACKYCFLPRKTTPMVEYIGERRVLVEKYKGRTESVGS